MSQECVRDELSDLGEGDDYQADTHNNLPNGNMDQQNSQEGKEFVLEQGEAEEEEEGEKQQEQKQSSKFVTKLKASSNKIASYVKETTGAVKNSITNIDFTMEKEAIKSLKTSTMDAFSNMGQKAVESGSWVWQAGKNAAAATGQRIRHAAFRRQTLQSVCKQEAMVRPCPRLLLCCANSLVVAGLKEQYLFEASVPQEQLDSLIDLFESGSGSVIIPPGTTPTAIACLLKHYVTGLPEPLLTYRNVAELTSTSMPLERSIVLLSQLPPPNATCVQLLLELFYYVQKNQKVNGMEVGRLVQAVSSCFLWKPSNSIGSPNQQQPSADEASEASDDRSDNSASTQKIPLSLEESRAFETVLSHWISNYHHIYYSTQDKQTPRTTVDAPTSKANSETSSSRQED